MQPEIVSITPDAMQNVRMHYTNVSDANKRAMQLAKVQAATLISLIDHSGYTRENKLAITKIEEGLMWHIKHLTGFDQNEDDNPHNPYDQYYGNPIEVEVRGLDVMTPEALGPTPPWRVEEDVERAAPTVMPTPLEDDLAKLKEELERPVDSSLISKMIGHNGGPPLDDDKDVVLGQATNEPLPTDIVGKVIKFNEFGDVASEHSITREMDERIRNEARKHVEREFKSFFDLASRS